jgi:hypothetical protein
VDIVSVDMERGRATADSLVFADKEIIILETAPNGLLSHIESIDLYKDNIYILDSRRISIYVFDRGGRYVSTIGRQGRGPGEYDRIMGFCIDRDNDEVLISTSDPDKIMYYSLSGQFLGETPTEEILFEMVKKDNILISRLLTNDSYDLALYEMDGHAVKSVKYLETPKLDTDKHRSISPSGAMLSGSKYGVLFTRPFDNTIYKIEGDDVKPLVTVDFGGFWQNNANLLPVDEVLRQFGDGYIYGITNAKLIDRDVVIFNAPTNGVFIVDGDVATHYGGISSNLSFDKSGRKDMTPILDPESDLVAFVYNASYFGHYDYMGEEERQRLTDEMVRLADLKDEDNPVIFLYRFK